MSDETRGHRFQFEVRENGKLIDGRPIPDPFIHTTIQPRGLRSAWRVLFGHMELVVHVAERPVVEGRQT